MSASEPVTVSITRTVKPGCEAGFERALNEFVQRSLNLLGQLGVHVMRPAPGSTSRDYGIMLCGRRYVVRPKSTGCGNAAVGSSRGAKRHVFRCLLRCVWKCE